jgi:3-methyladenine DNA glycosylase AlkD
MKEILSEIRRKVKARDNGPAMDSMRNLGINYKTIHGLSIEEIKNIAINYQYNHELALELWKWDHREFKILATLIENPKTVSVEQIILWAKELENSELAEQLSINLAFNTGKTEQIIPLMFLIDKDFSRKSACVLLAWTAQRSANIPDSFFAQQLKQLPQYINESLQLSKGISFAIRAIGKRNLFLNKRAISLLKQLDAENSYYSKLIVADALWELESDIIQKRLA